MTFTGNIQNDDERDDTDTDLIQGVALTGCNTTGPPCSVGQPTVHASGGRPARLPGSVADDGRRQSAKQYGPVKTFLEPKAE